MTKALKGRLGRLERQLWGKPGEEPRVIIITHGYMPEECLAKLRERLSPKDADIIGFITPAPGEPCPVCGQVHETPEQHAERGRKAQEALRERINNIGAKT